MSSTSSSSKKSLTFRYGPRAASQEEHEKEQDRLIFMWMFSPNKLTMNEIKRLKGYVNRDKSIRGWIRELINRL